MNPNLPTLPELLKTKEEKKIIKSSIEINPEFDLSSVNEFQVNIESNEVHDSYIEIELPTSLNKETTADSDGLKWQQLLKSSKKGELDINLTEQLQWGQMVDMLIATAPETNWRCLWIGKQHLSSDFLGNVFHFLKNLILSPDWHSPQNAEILFGQWNGLPSFKITWEKTNLPPLFINESDDLEVFVEYQNGREVINFLEIHYSSDKRKEV